MKKLTLITLLCILLSAIVNGQTLQIRGRVNDSSSRSLSNVSVSVVDGRGGTSTDKDGNFTITVSGRNSVSLLFSFIGYESQTITTNGSSPLSVTLQAGATAAGDEVIVIGYGAVRKKDLTGAVTSLKGDELRKVPTANVVEAAQGKIAGADITKSSGQAGSGVTIRLRGNRSTGGNNAPLIIVDGVIYGNIEDINANDIESMEVLKDASSIAIYGSRGANGVILITTKKGSAGKANVTVNSYAGVSRVSMYPKAMNLDEFVAFRREAYRAANAWSSPADDPTAFSNAAELNAVRKGIWTDYQDALIHPGLQQDYQVGLSAGTEKLKVYMSLDYFNENGILKKDWLKRYTGRLNLEYTINPRLKLGMQNQLTYL